MTAEIIELDTYFPRVPRDQDTELSIRADLSMLDRLERWTALQKSICVRNAKPMPPSVRLLAMDAMDILDL